MILLSLSGLYVGLIAYVFNPILPFLDGAHLIDLVACASPLLSSPLFSPFSPSPLPARIPDADRFLSLFMRSVLASIRSGDGDDLQLSPPGSRLRSR
jgi:hypothetical protein